MRVQLFHVGDGDCLLLSIDEEPAASKAEDSASAGDAASPAGPAEAAGSVERTILVDGGRKTAFRANARDEIYRRERLDLIYVSHIDDDHISAVVGLMEDEVAWRVHDRRVAKGERARKPRFPRPPAIGEIWHNALFELVGDELEPHVPGALAASAATLAGASDEPLRDLAASLDNLATGEKSSMELSRRISDRQLDIPRNRPRNQVMRVGNAREREVGPFHINELGPTQEALDDLKERWQGWLANNAEALRTLQSKMLDDEERLGASIPVAPPGVVTALGEGSITAPNLASLMLLVRDPATGGRILLTGDGSSEDVLAGLAAQNLLDDDGRLHVEALKLQHHGALANMTEDFVRRVTADHYLFCGNGAHHNPELEVVEALARARLHPTADDHPPVGPPTPFTFWFSSRHDSPKLSERRQAHMQHVEDLVASLQADHDPDDRLSATFLRKDHLTLEI